MTIWEFPPLTSKQMKGKGGAEYKGNEKVSVAGNSSQISKLNVYRFTDEHGEKKYKYLIVAPDAKTAAKVARGMVTDVLD